MQLVAVSGYSGDMLHPICLKYEFNRWPVHTYRAFKVIKKIVWTFNLSYNLKYPPHSPCVSSCTHLRLAYERSRSPSAVGVNMAVPTFMLSLRLTNHWALVANPTRYHFPAICGHTCNGQQGRNLTTFASACI